MASYLETNPPVFNQYVQQLPVDAMVKVGVQRQQQYEQGLEKIQSTIDNVAGLDIANPTQQAYLKSKLSSLGNKLRYTAAADFSNFQLVNSVNGMTNEIVKDKNIQTAVYSTAKIRKEQASLETARKEGKSAPQNENRFNNLVSQYINNTNVDASFNGRYKTFTDLNKKWTETVKTLHPNLSEQDIVTVTKYKADGVTVDSVATADAMETLTHKGISAQQIDNALRSSLNSDDIEQLNIDAEYRFRGTDNSQTPKIASDFMDDLQKKRNNQITFLKTQMAFTNGKGAVYQNYVDSLANLEEKNLNHEKEKQSFVELAYKNPDSVKSLIYKEATINEFTNANSWEEKQRKISTNPVLIAEQKRVDQGFEKTRIELEKHKQQYKELDDVFKNNVAERTLRVAEKRLEMEENAATGIGGPGTVMPISTKIVDSYTLSSNEIAKNKVVVDGFVQDLVKAAHFDGSLYKNDHDRNVAYAAVIAQAQKTYNDYKNDKTKTQNIPNNLLEKAEAARLADVDRTSIQSAIKFAKQEAKEDEDFDPEIAPLKSKYNSLKHVVKPVTLSYANGKKLVISTEELLEYNKKLNDGSKFTDFDGKPIFNFNQKEKEIEKYLHNNPNQKGLFINDNVRQLQFTYTDYETKRREKEAIKLNDKLIDFHPIVTGIITKDKEGKSTAVGEKMNQIVDQALMLASKAKNFGNELGYEDVDVDKVRLLQEDPKTRYHKVFVPGTKEYSIEMVNEKIGSQTVPIKDVLAISSLPQSKYDSSPEKMRLQTAVSRGRRGVANPTQDPLLEPFQAGDFRNINLFTVTGSLTQVENDTSSNFLDLKVTLPSGKKISVSPYNLRTKNGSSKMTLEDMSNLVHNELNDVALAQLILNDKTQSIETIQEVKRMFSTKK